MNKKKILIVDDEVGFTRILKFGLESTGKYEVKIENKGSLALATAKAFKPDLILLDILMPDMPGSEVALQLKEDDSVKDIPVVFLTAIATKEDTTERGGIIGGHPFIAKPADLEELVECIDKNIRR